MHGGLGEVRSPTLKIVTPDAAHPRRGQVRPLGDDASSAPDRLVAAPMNTTVRTRSAGCLLLADRRGTLTSRRSRAWGDPVAGPLRFMTIGRFENARRLTLAVEIGVIPDKIALAFAQLVRDRWAAEGREMAERQGSLRVLVTRECR